MFGVPVGGEVEGRDMGGGGSEGEGVFGFGVRAGEVLQFRLQEDVKQVIMNKYTMFICSFFI